MRSRLQTIIHLEWNRLALMLSPYIVTQLSIPYCAGRLLQRQFLALSANPDMGHPPIQKMRHSQLQNNDFFQTICSTHDSALYFIVLSLIY